MKATPALIGALAVALLISVSPTDDGTRPLWAWSIVAIIVALWTLSVILRFHESWRDDFAKRFDDPISLFYAGLDDGYRNWRISRIGMRAEAPWATWHLLAEGSQRWVLAFIDAESDDEELILAFAKAVYPRAGNVVVPRDRYTSFHTSRESIANYLTDIGKKARRGTPLRWWVKKRIREHEVMVRMLLYLEVALRYQRTHGARQDIYDSPLAKIPKLFREGKK